MQKGIIVIPKTQNLDRLTENFQANQVQLSAEDIVEIEKLDKGMRLIDP